MNIIKIVSVFFILNLLVACSGGGNDPRAPFVSAPTNITVIADNNGYITISGKATPNSKVIITMPDGTTKEAVVDSNGDFSIVSNTPQGSGTVSVVASDADGNQSTSATENFSTHPVAPTNITVIADNNGYITVSGKATPNSKVIITMPDGSTKEAVVDANGDFSIVSNTPQGSGTVTVVASDADGNESTSATENFSAQPVAPFDITVTADANSIVTVAGKGIPNAKITVTLPDGRTQETTVDANGNFTLSSIAPQNSGDVKVVSENAQGATSATMIEIFTANLDSTDVLKALYKQTGVMPDLPFSPSLGINTEGPQSGSIAAGSPIAFVDIFRTALPFPELSGSSTFDDNGWPMSVDSTSNVARTKLLQGARPNSIPNGTYTVLYDIADSSSVSLEFNQRGPVVTNTHKIPNENKYTFDLNLQNFNSNSNSEAETNAVNLNVRGINPSNYVRNIRIIMPGGTCRDESGEFNPYIRVESQAECPTSTEYVSFEQRLKDNRNEIIFNPDYLLFLRNFKLVRMMNIMQASSKKLCKEEALNCPNNVGTWETRALLSDAVWGGDNGRTAPENHKGVPIEVMLELANTLKKDIWINIPHVATDDYVRKYAEQVYTGINDSSKIYLEYSNEVWNSGFASFNFTTREGLKNSEYSVVPDIFYPSFQETALEFKRLCDENRSSRCEDYFARFRYFSQRSVEIFDIWESYFGANSSRLERVLGSLTTDKVLTDLMLDFIEEKYGINKVDSVAIAPYFYGCPYKINDPDNNRFFCQNAQKTLEEADSVDDIFDVINQDLSIDPKGIDGTLESTRQHAEVALNRDVKLITYEGGQHLSTSVLRETTSNEDKSRLKLLFDETNRDPRMKDLYVKFLNGWKSLHDNDQSTELFTLYTMPQAYYQHGNFGIKEHLNQTRAEAPKFDGAMSFQETQKECWWDGCNP